jgi:hypothetical protein
VEGGWKGGLVLIFIYVVYILIEGKQRGTEEEDKTRLSGKRTMEVTNWVPINNLPL